ncbi:MAG: hypothetical protein ACJ786_11550, partial [Catenulispora sp.]
MTNSARRPSPDHGPRAQPLAPVPADLGLGTPAVRGAMASLRRLPSVSGPAAFAPRFGHPGGLIDAAAVSDGAVARRPVRAGVPRPAEARHAGTVTATASVRG